MNILEAVQFINHEIAWEPGLRVTARLHPTGFGFDYELRVHFALETVDSGRISRDGHYPAGPDALFEVGFTRVLYPHEYAAREQLLHRVIRHVTELRQHETREFTRVRDEAGNWVAPFFPHSEDGNDLWRYGGRPYIKEEKDAKVN